MARSGVIRAYKYRIYPTKKQENQMQEHLWTAKNLWNALLAHSNDYYQKTGKFPGQYDLQKLVKGKGLYAQTQQAIAHKVSNSIFRVFKLKKKGVKCGFPRFKSIDRMKSLVYPQLGFKLEKKLYITPFGEINIKKHREIEGKIKTLILKRESSGKWFAILCSEKEKQQEQGSSRMNKEQQIGIDLGLKYFATLSNGEVIKNPRHLKGHEEQLSQLQRRLSKSKKGSHNRKKAKLKVARLHEKISNTRMDFLHKTSLRLVNTYSLIALEKLASSEMLQKNFGKQINDAGWNMFANMVSYKAESAGCNIVFVNPKNTTKLCSGCGAIVEKELSERIHRCPSCGLVTDRDLNAARNILIRATEGHSGSQASGDNRKEVLSLKEEAHNI